MKRALLPLAVVGLGVTTPALADDFAYMPPGDLIPGSGKGRVDSKVYAPDMLFPIEGKAYANSQVYMTGGSNGPSGSQCATVNFSYPWRDNYCETRSWDMPLCPAGVGHQGQDIRAATCEKNVHWARAAVDGTITSIGSYTVYVTAADGTRYDYLHMDSVQVKVGQKVKRGDHLGKVSNNFGGTSTSVHLHFNLKQNVSGVGFVFVPPYLSLVKAYQATLTQPPRGALEFADCNRIAGWAFDPEKSMDGVDVELAVDGATASADAHVIADKERKDLCDTLGSCNHAFDAPSPLSLFDGAEHTVRFRAIDSTDGKGYELLESPGTLTCGPITPKGVRRPLDSAALAAWKLTHFWDELPADASGLPVGAAMPAEPKAYVDTSDSEVLWVVDGATRRKLLAADAADWHLDVATLPTADAAVMALTEGPAFPVRAIWVTVDGAAFLVDDVDAGGGGGGTDSQPNTTPAGVAGGFSESSSCAVSLEQRASPVALLVLSAVLAAAKVRRSRSRSR